MFDIGSESCRFCFRGEFRLVLYLQRLQRFSIYIFLCVKNATKTLAHSSRLGCLIYQVVFGFFLVNHKASGH